VLVGGGPEEEVLSRRLGRHATFLGWLEEKELARVYASADIFLLASRTDTFGQVVIEAQASGLPVVAVAEGGPLSLIESGRSGRLCPPDAQALAAAVAELARFPELRRRLGDEALASVGSRTWEHALDQLAAGYRSALSATALSGGEARRTAA
jgi:glycosyltransferase involved in cell wall biosynthesis